MCDNSLLLASTSGTSFPKGTLLQKIYVIISSEPDDEATDIPVAEGVQENYPKDSVVGVAEALYTDLFQLVEDSDQIEEIPGKAVVKDAHSKTRKDREEVIQAVSDLKTVGQENFLKQLSRSI